MTLTSRGAARTFSFARGSDGARGEDGPGASVARLGEGLGVVWVTGLVTIAASWSRRWACLWVGPARHAFLMAFLYQPWRRPSVVLFTAR